MLTTLVMCTTLIGLHAQENFYEGLAKFDGVKFNNHHNCSKIKGKEGYYRPGTIYEKNGIITFQVDRLPSGTPYGFRTMNEDGSRNSFWQSQLGDHEVDHQTYTSYHKFKSSRNAYVFIDSMLIEVKKISSDGLSFEGLGNIFLPVEEKGADKSKPKKKKMTMKERFAAVKNGMKNGYSTKGSEIYKKMVNTNMDELITNYLKEMKAKQASSNQAKENKIIAEIDKARKQGDANLQAYNDSLYNTPEYQRIRENKARIASAEGSSSGKSFTIVNTGNSTLKFYSAGMLQTILAGRSKKMNCTYDIYGVIKEGTTSKKGNLIYDGDDICGKTINMK